jgi:hypothetical protein
MAVDAMNGFELAGRHSECSASVSTVFAADP